jgi:hypothetical protein
VAPGIGGAQAGWAGKGGGPARKKGSGPVAGLMAQAEKGRRPGRNLCSG